MHRTMICLYYFQKIGHILIAKEAKKIQQSEKKLKWIKDTSNSAAIKGII
jgi:hypothetical protein